MRMCSTSRAIALEAWTASEPGPLDPAKFVVPRLTQFPTFDRSRRKIAADTRVPLRAGEPGTASRAHRAARGPMRSSGRRFDPWIEYVVNELGFAVLAPNVRGSTGYGKTYRALDGGDVARGLGQGCRRAPGVARPRSRFDAKHVVVSGAGYGGYLALAALVNYGERLRGAVDFGGHHRLHRLSERHRSVPPESGARGVRR